jgi:hypothetical protein
MTTDGVDRSRAWILGGRLLIVVFLGVVVMLAINGVHPVLVVLVGLAIGMTGSLLLAPDRSWWGPQPALILSDSERKAAYRKSEIRFLVVAFVGIAILLPVVLAFMTDIRAQ